MYKILSKTLSITLFLSAACVAQKPQMQEGTLKGVIGLYEGNCMPGPGVPPCLPRPIAATILITKLAEVFISDLLVKEIQSDENGFYEVNLPPGEFSFFLKDGDQVVCTLIQCPDQCFCHPFEIKTDSTTVIDANLDHASW